MMPPLRIALGEYDTLWHDREGSLACAETVVRGAVAVEAPLVVLPEMCTTGFTMDAGRAEPMDGPSVSGLREMAAAHGVHLIAGVALRESPDRAVNAAVVIDPDGELRATYGKQRVFAYGGEHEVYAPGTAAVTCEVRGVRLALFVCYDLRFPELFRAVARDVDAMIVIANWPAVRRPHWDVLLRARAIENQCYVVGVNRTGNDGSRLYDGGSAAWDPWGEAVTVRAGGTLTADVDPERVRSVRAEYPFLADMTP